MAAPELPPGWTEALAPVVPQVVAVSARVAAARAAGLPVAPASGSVFRALSLTPPDAVRVVILGQDPYPTPGNADGLAFSVPPGVDIPASLRNVFREMEADLGLPVPASGDLEPWARQGVLLLNTCLTVTEGLPRSHAGWGWEIVTDAIIDAISAQSLPTVFLLWGNDARAKADRIAGHHVVIEATHPSPLAAWRGFFGSRPFSRANAALAAAGREEVAWRLGTP